MMEPKWIRLHKIASLSPPERSNKCTVPLADPTAMKRSSSLTTISEMSAGVMPREALAEMSSMLSPEEIVHPC